MQMSCCATFDKDRSYIYARENSLEMNNAYTNCCGYFCDTQDDTSVKYFDRGPFRRQCGFCCFLDDSNSCTMRSDPRPEVMKQGCVCCCKEIVCDEIVSFNGRWLNLIPRPRACVCLEGGGVVYMGACACARACVCVCMCYSVCLCMRVCVRACVPACLRTCLRACVPACLRACLRAIVSESCVRVCSSSGCFGVRKIIKCTIISI